MPRRQLDLPDQDAVIDEVRRLQEKGGTWDRSQVCRHVAIPMHECIDGFTFSPPAIVRFLGTLLMKKSHLKKRSIRPGLTAPPQFVPEPANPFEAIAELEKAVQRFQSHRGAFHKHPVFGQLTPDQWHQLHTIHCMHHLIFLRPK